MKRYVDAILLKAEFTGNFTETYSSSLIKAIIDQQPEADVQDIKHAQWYDDPRLPKIVRGCSNCGGCGYFHYKFCPHCGAKMDGGKSDE